MANISSLTPFKKGEQRARDCAKKAQAKRAENNLWSKTLKEGIRENMTDKDFQQIVSNLIERAKVDTKTFEVLRDTIGEKPTDKVEATIEQPTFIEDLDD